MRKRSRRSAEFERRSRAAKLGWQTRRENERRRFEKRRSRRSAEFERRSRAAKLGWQTRRENERRRFEKRRKEEERDFIVVEPVEEVGGEGK